MPAVPPGNPARAVPAAGGGGPDTGTALPGADRLPPVALTPELPAHPWVATAGRGGDLGAGFPGAATGLTIIP